MTPPAVNAQVADSLPLRPEPEPRGVHFPGAPHVARDNGVTPLLPSVPSALQRRQDDDLLAARVGRQRPDPFDVLFERHWARLRTYCLGILGSADEAQDAAQETMVRAYKRLWRTSDVPPVKPLLYAIARNVCIDRLRERRRVGVQVEEHHLPAVAGTDEIAARRGRVSLLVADLRALSERQRTALVLREACGLSHQEIAQTLETTAPRVKSLISEARQALTERRAGRDLSCEEYRRALVRLPGRMRNQRLLAHRAACARCGEAPATVYALGLPGLALTWLLRGARRALGAVGAPGGTPTAAKFAVAAACLGTAVVPAVTPPLQRGTPRPDLATVTHRAHASAAPAVPARRRKSTPAHTTAGTAAVVRALLHGRAAKAARDAGQRAVELPLELNRAVDAERVGDHGQRHHVEDAVPASLSAVQRRLRDTVAVAKHAPSVVARRATNATSAVRRIAASVPRDVRQALRPASGPTGASAGVAEIQALDPTLATLNRL